MLVPVELIETEERARRLARTIASDIVLYNREKPKSGSDLASEIEEGRTLFRGRVAPALHWVFDEVLAGTPLGGTAQAGAPTPQQTLAKAVGGAPKPEPARPAVKPEPAPVPVSSGARKPPLPAKKAPATATPRPAAATSSPSAVTARPAAAWNKQTQPAVPKAVGAQAVAGTSSKATQPEVPKPRAPLPERAVARPSQPEAQRISALPGQGSKGERLTPAPPRAGERLTPPPAAAGERLTPSPAATAERLTPPPADAERLTPLPAAERLTPPPADAERLTPPPADAERLTPPPPLPGERLTPPPPLPGERLTPPPPLPGVAAPAARMDAATTTTPALPVQATPGPASAATPQPPAPSAPLARPAARAQDDEAAPQFRSKKPWAGVALLVVALVLLVVWLMRS